MLYNGVCYPVNSMARPRAYDDDLRARLLDAASELLAADGPHALSTRRIAAEVGTSTTAIYTLIGSKEDLVRAIYVEGFRRLAAHLDAVPEDPDPLVHLAGLGRAYLDNALENPALYQVMFARPVPEFSPSDEDHAFTLSTLQTLIDGVARCVNAGLFQGNAEDIALELWSISHGFASLAIAGSIPPDRVRRLSDHGCAAMVIGLLSGQALLPTRDDPSPRSFVTGL